MRSGWENVAQAFFLWLPYARQRSRTRCADAAKPIAGGELTRDVQPRAKFGGKKPEREAAKLCEEAVTLVARGCLGGPYSYTTEGELRLNGVGEIVNPALRCGVQRAT